ncbi:hypothetical protein Tco_0458134 [Tanacetum coccineum]
MEDQRCLLEMGGSNRQRKILSTWMTVLSIFDREIRMLVYQLMIKMEFLEFTARLELLEKVYPLRKEGTDSRCEMKLELKKKILWHLSLIKFVNEDTCRVRIEYKIDGLKGFECWLTTTQQMVIRYVFVLNRGVVDWKSTKQSIFTTSSVEAEYIAAYDASKEAVWVRKFIFGLGVVSIIEEPINMYYDNTGAITIANESVITKGARHFHAKVHYVCEVIEYGDIKLEKVHYRIRSLS